MRFLAMIPSPHDLLIMSLNYIHILLLSKLMVFLLTSVWFLDKYSYKFSRDIYFADVTNSAFL